MSIAVIINPITGLARPEDARLRAERAAAVIERQGEEADVLVTQHQGHGRELATAAVRRGARLVMVWGGDGTINEVASALAFSETPLGIIPAGSGNGLARALHIRAQPEQAICTAMRAKPRAIDLGELGGRLFVNLAGIGLDAHVAAQFNAAGGRRRGLARYMGLAARALVTYVPARYVISGPGLHLNVRAVLVALANSTQYGNGAQIAPQAQIDDGQLDLVVVRERSRLVTVCQTPRLFNGSVGRMPECSIHRVRDVRVECPDRMAFHVDGEPVEGDATLIGRVHPAALRICAA
jgi:YegS/Rv2252/BmrU family lipid kinase